MPSPFFSGRIPQELFDHVEAHRKSTGESKTDVLVKALAAYTGFEDNSNIDNTSIPKTSEILERLERVEAHVFGNRAETEVSEIKERQYNLLDQIEEVEEAIEEEKKPKASEEEAEILTTSEMVDRKIVGSGSKLSGWKRDDKLPIAHKGFLINKSTEEEKAKKNLGKKGKPQDCWKITPV